MEINPQTTENIKTQEQNKTSIRAFFKYNLGVKALLLTSTIGTFVFGLFGPFYVIFTQKFGGSIQVAGYSWAAFSIVSGVLILTFSSLESSFKDKKILYIVGLVIRAIAFLLYMVITSYYQLILTQILLGISVALINPSFDSLFTAQTNKENSLTDWGGWEGLNAIATGAAAILGGYFISIFGFNIIFVGMIVLTLAQVLYLLMLPKTVLK